MKTQKILHNFWCNLLINGVGRIPLGIFRCFTEHLYLCPCTKEVYPHQTASVSLHFTFFHLVGMGRNRVGQSSFSTHSCSKVYDKMVQLLKWRNLCAICMGHQMSLVGVMRHVKHSLSGGSHWSHCPNH